MDRFEWIATAAFGLEGVVAREFLRGQADQKSLLSAALVRSDEPQGGM